MSQVGVPQPTRFGFNQGLKDPGSNSQAKAGEGNIMMALQEVLDNIQTVLKF